MRLKVFIVAGVVLGLCVAQVSYAVPPSSVYPKNMSGLPKVTRTIVDPLLVPFKDLLPDLYCKMIVIPAQIEESVPDERGICLQKNLGFLKNFNKFLEDNIYTAMNQRSDSCNKFDSDTKTCLSDLQSQLSRDKIHCKMLGDIPDEINDLINSIKCELNINKSILDTILGKYDCLFKGLGCLPPS